MSGSSRAITALSALIVTLLLGGMVTVYAAGTGTVEPPPRTAFLARADNPADALAAGPVAGRLGAPLFTTPSNTLDVQALGGLVDYGPELVILTGGTAALSAAVEEQVAAALPEATVRRVSGAGRTETARRVAELIAEYNPGFLPVDATAADADLLDGLDSAAFVRAGDATAVDAVNATSASAPETLPSRLLQSGGPMTSFSTTRSGVLQLTLHAVVVVKCDPGREEWGWLELDGTPIHGSLTRLPRLPSGTEQASQSFTAVTAERIPAGDHTMALATGCSPDSAGHSMSWYEDASGSVVVFD